jgi:hypothetical protein
MPSLAAEAVIMSAIASAPRRTEPLGIAHRLGWVRDDIDPRLESIRPIQIGGLGS